MLPTPSTSHVPSQVYPASEDSFLLLDTLSSTSELDFLSARFPTSSPSPLLVEIGTGSGVVLAFSQANAQAIFSRSDILSIGVDVNPYACLAASETVKLACHDAALAHRTGCLLACVRADLLSVLRSSSVDVLIFNPPYVPTPGLPSAYPPSPSGARDARDAAFQEESYFLELAYAGGNEGLETTKRFLERVRDVLNERGVLYLLLCLGNGPENVRRRIKEWGNGWRAEIVGSSGKTAGWEKLFVLKVWKDLILSGT